MSATNTNSSPNPLAPHRWNSDEARGVLRDAESLVSSRVKSFWAGFSEFAVRDNVLGVALGVTVATAFSKLVNSVVSDVILPPISLLPFMSRNLDEQFVVLRGGPGYTMNEGYNTRAQALADGALILSYGNFLDEIMSFIGIGVALYVIAILYGAFTKDTLIKQPDTKCQYCSTKVKAKTLRCPSCTSWLDGREDTISKTGPLVNI